MIGNNASQEWTTGLCSALLLVLVAIGNAGPVTGQARVVVNNDAWIRIDNGAWVVVENPLPVGIQTLGTGGNIRSEGEFNRVRWQIRNTLGTYVVPFTTAAGTKMPLSYTPLVAGSAEATASVCFSTFNHASQGIPLANAWNNDLYRPSDVTHMNSYNAPSVPNSQNAVDRFWIIDPGVAGYAYGTLPSIALGFTYDPGVVFGEVTAGNAIGPLDPVGAQRFNNAAGIWGDYLPSGTWAGGLPSSVVTATASSADFFRSWTLANFLEPLPVRLVHFASTCEAHGVQLSWSTASESNSAYFDVERSADGIDFRTVGRVAAAGNSQHVQQYSFFDAPVRGLVYHRLLQVDSDGASEYGPLVSANCGSGSALELVNAWDDGSALQVVISSPIEEAATLSMIDASGKLVRAEALQLRAGNNAIALGRMGLASGVYLLRLTTRTEQHARRLQVME